jgi:hypothetical protein
MTCHLPTAAPKNQQLVPHAVSGSPNPIQAPENRGQPTPDPPARKRDSQHPASSIPTQSRANLDYSTQNAITIKPTNHSAFNPSLNPILIQTPFVLYLISPNVIFHLPQKQTTNPKKSRLDNWLPRTQSPEGQAAMSRVSRPRFPSLRIALTARIAR